MEEGTASGEGQGGGNKSTFLVVGGVVLLLILGGVGYAFKHQIKTALMGGNAPTQENAPAPVASTAPETAASVSPAMTAAAVEVDYTNAGFTPKSVTIKKGQTVKFINKTTGTMSVASNPHPQHTDYPGFDQWKSDAKGKAEYDFTFDKVGTWGYHNHFQPSDGGTVTVTE